MAAESTSMVAIDDVQTELRRTGDADLIDDLSSAALDPVVALQAVTGMRTDSVLYQFSMGGKPVVGFTVKGAKALAARRGGFEVHEPRVEDVVIPIESGDGNWVDVPAVRATVQVTDKRNDTTFVASVTRPRIKVLRDGGHSIDQHTEANAVARATRNAILDHFAGVTDVVKNFVVEAQKSGKVYVIGEADAQAEEVSRAIATQQAKRRAMRSTPVGKMGAGLFRAKVEQAEQDGGVQAGVLVRDLAAYMQSRWPGLKLDEVPLSEMGTLEQWLQEKRQQLGLDQGEGDEEPMALPESAQDEPAEAATPAPQTNASKPRQPKAQPAQPSLTDEPQADDATDEEASF